MEKAEPGKVRKYIHDQEEAEAHQQEPGTFTPWEEMPLDSDMLFYEGLHGAIVTETVNVARHCDLLIGVVPVINLEWIQKLHRDKMERGYTQEAIVDTILRRIPDYVNYICPQFLHTHVNFQRVPTVGYPRTYGDITIAEADNQKVPPADKAGTPTPPQAATPASPSTADVPPAVETTPGEESKGKAPTKP